MNSLVDSPVQMSTERPLGIKNLAKALLKAQQEMGSASKSTSNPYFKSKYADYGSVLEAVKVPLNNAGVVILQLLRPGHKNGSYVTPTVVVTTLVHAESGEQITSETPVVVARDNDPQAFGSAITYSRRYGLQSLLALPTEDDDGEGAMARGKSTPTKVTQAKPSTKVDVPQTQEVTKPAVKSTFKKPATVVVSEPTTQSEAPSEADGWEN